MNPLATDHNDAPLATEASSNSPRSGGYRIPFTMPREQMYYWRFDWQNGEQEALCEFEAGEYERFDSDDPEDIVRWLHEPE